MDYKQIFIYALLFGLGFVVGKVLKINVSSNSGCNLGKNYLQQFKMKLSSENSETYL